MLKQIIVRKAGPNNFDLGEVFNFYKGPTLLALVASPAGPQLFPPCSPSQSLQGSNSCDPREVCNFYRALALSPLMDFAMGPPISFHPPHRLDRKLFTQTQNIPT